MWNTGLHVATHDFVFARFNRAHGRGVAVCMWFAAEMIEARVAAAGALRRIEIDFFEVTEDRINRSVQTVKIHAVKSGRRFFGIKTSVEFAQPLNEFDHNGVTPHPSGEPAKSRKRFVWIRVVARAAHVAMDTRRIWPIRLNRDHSKAFFSDKPFRDCRALGVKFVRSVRCFAQQHDPRVADQFQQRFVIFRAAGKRSCDLADNLDVVHCRSSAARASKSRTSSSLVCEKSS